MGGFLFKTGFMSILIALTENEWTFWDLQLSLLFGNSIRGMETAWKELIFLKWSLYCALLFLYHDLNYIMNYESPGETEYIQGVFEKFRIKTEISIPYANATLPLYLLKISINQIFVTHSYINSQGL